MESTASDMLSSEPVSLSPPLPVVPWQLAMHSVVANNGVNFASVILPVSVSYCKNSKKCCDTGYSDIKSACIAVSMNLIVNFAAVKHKSETMNMCSIRLAFWLAATLFTINAMAQSQNVNVLKYKLITDTLRMMPEVPENDRYTRITDEDYEQVASELGVEVAAVKAVVDIEAGRAHEGFYEPGLPIINFDMTMFRKFARKKGVNLSSYTKSHQALFSRLNARRHGSTQAAQYVRFRAACSIDSIAAIEGTFWGMFQIGGFNWKICGCSSITEFIERMSFSEREQLELFAAFLKSTGMDKYLRAKNWSAFARRYNGTQYARRGYHTRLAAAYRRHSKKISK